MRRLTFMLLLAVLYMPTAVFAQHGGGQHQSAAPATDEVTVSIRQNDFPLCGTPFYDALYALTVEVFAVGAPNVELSVYEDKVFALIRSAEEFKGNAEAFVEHVKDIPRQLVQIIAEDPAVLDSCANFSVALVGPP